MGESKGMRETLAALWPNYKEKLDLSECELGGFQTTAAVMELHEANEAKQLPRGRFIALRLFFQSLGD